MVVIVYIVYSVLLDFVYIITDIIYIFLFFFFKQKTAYEMRISDWSSDVCSSDLETLAAQAKEVAEVGKELYRRLSTMGAHVAKLGRNLNLATGAYNDFVGSLESQVLTQAKRFEALKVETGGKSIESLPIVDTPPRALTKLDTTEAEAAE